MVATPATTVETRHSNLSDRNYNVDQLVDRIRELQQTEAETHTALLQCRIEIGEELAKLKQQTEHGEWLAHLSQLNCSERRAQRLIQIARSPLAEQIRTNGTDLAARLPEDMQKLCYIARLSGEQLDDFLARCDVVDLSRDELGRHVRLWRGEAADDDPAIGEQSVSADAEVVQETADSTETTNGDSVEGSAAESIQADKSSFPVLPSTERNTADSPDNSDGTDANASEDSHGPDSPDNASEEPAPQDESEHRKAIALHRKRCTQFRQFQDQGYLTFAPGTPEDKFLQAELGRIVHNCRKASRKLHSKAMQVGGFDADYVEMALIAQLSSRLDSQVVCAPATDEAETEPIPYQ